MLLAENLHKCPWLCNVTCPLSRKEQVVVTRPCQLFDCPGPCVLLHHKVRRGSS
jgi:hypothetical protein